MLKRLTPEELEEIRNRNTHPLATDGPVERLLAHIAALEEEIAMTRTDAPAELGREYQIGAHRGRVVCLNAVGYERTDLEETDVYDYVTADWFKRHAALAKME